MHSVELERDELIHTILALVIYDLYIHNKIALAFDNDEDEADFASLEERVNNIDNFECSCKPVHRIWDKINIEAELANLPSLS